MNMLRALILLTLLTLFPGCGSSGKETPVPGDSPKLLLTNVTVTPSSASISRGTTQQFTLRAGYSDGTNQDVTGAATWVSSDPASVSINNSGLATGNNASVVNITGTFNGKSASTNLTVTAAVLRSLSLFPVNPTIANGTSLSFGVNGTFSDNTTQNLTTAATWSSSNVSVVNVSSVGNATTVAPGNVVVNVSVGGLSASTNLTVSNTTLLSLAINPNPVKVTVGATRALRALGTFSDGSIQDLTSAASWSSATPANASVNDVVPNRGRVTGVTIASLTQVTATLPSGLNASVVVNVVPLNFQATPSVVLSGTPSDLVVGFWNADGNLDLAVPTGTGVDILLGAGDGTFAAPNTTGAIGAGPAFVVTGLLNVDAFQDLVTSNLGGQSVSALLGNGAGAFAQAGGNFTTGAATDPRGLVLLDLNNDGKLDVATANSNAAANNVSVLLGNGAGAFGTPSGFPTGNGAVALTGGHFNGDAFLDLAVTCNISNCVTVRFNNGAGAFPTFVNVTVGTNPRRSHVGDLNGDGFLDFITANFGSNDVSVNLGNGAGGFTQTTVATGLGPVEVVARDFNGDGLLDLAVANSGSNSISIFDGDGTGAFALRATIPVGGAPVGIRVGDFNNDGRFDLAVAKSDGSVMVLLQLP